MAKTNTVRRNRKRKVVSDEISEGDNINIEGQTEAVSSSEQIFETEHDAPIEIIDKKLEDKDRDEQDSQMDAVIEVKGSNPTVTVTWKKKNDKEREGDDLEKSCANGKRKAHNDETSPSKKPKLINDGFCLFVGNLNNSKTFEEVKDSLANYFMKQSLLVQDIRLDRSKKHAYVDLASEMDLTKALKLNGEMILDKPMKIAKARVKSEDKVKVKDLALEKKAKDARCLFLKNVPYNATKEDILKIFHTAIAVRFPGGTEGPSKGVAFVEFKKESTARKVRQKKQGVEIQGRVVIVDFVGETIAARSSQATKANDDSNDTKAAAPQNNTLFVSNLSYNVTEEKLKKVFQKAVNVKIPQARGKPKGFAFLEFATVADAEKALQSSQNIKLCKRTVKVHFCKNPPRQENEKVQKSKTLIVMGLAEKTTAETLTSAFEGALRARIPLDKDTGLSKRFGFVDFESEENCKAVKEAMEDCEINGSKVTVDYARIQGEGGHQGARGGPVRCPADQPAGNRAGRGGHRARGPRGSRGGKTLGAGTPKEAVKEVENKG
ncbi:nucleolin-like isoform X2 [Anabas testudineus]|uniref:RRM domain-containing protein n=1 Tax=Anabas testudineus TaxID=64144 RepID=A0A3Q1J2A0_ANATE|nr:nucleolin-like isoform X2 [Anabas testudineus]